MKFTKMQGLGNDYVYVNCLDGMPKTLPSLQRKFPTVISASARTD